MSRKTYDKKIFKTISMMDIDFEHPDWTPEQKAAELENPDRIAKTTHNLTIVDLRDRLFEEHGGTYSMKECASEARYLMDGVPSELIVNINEWLDGTPLSDVKIHGVYINDVFEMFVKNRPIHFIQIVRCMVKWKESDYFNDDFCWHYFARM